MPNTTTNSRGYKELDTKNHIILKSYETFVAILDKLTKTLIVVDEFYSQTTSRHIKLFKSRFRYSKEERKSQKELDILVFSVSKN